MAKRNEESGPGTGMILMLVFFVLATLILGVTTYMGYSGQDELETQAKAAKEEAKKAQDVATEERLRKIVLRGGSGTADPDDLKDLAGAPDNMKPHVADEITRLTNKVGAAGVLPGGKGDGLVWAPGPDGSPGVAPRRNLTGIAKEWERIAKGAQDRANAEKVAREKAQLDTQAAQAGRDKDKEAFDASVKALNEQMAAKIKAMDAAFLALKTEADKKGIDFQNIEKQWAEEKTRMEEQLTAKLNDLKVERDRRLRAENPDPSDIEGRWKNLPIVKMAERMGTITDKSESFVSLQFSQRLVLVPGQTFVVIPANRSLVEVLDREKSLEKTHHERVSLGAREPFAGNELIKGMVEITDVTSPYTARARITYETAPIRNPLGRGDQIFNMTLSTGDKEHVALAGIVDLDGDGRPDTEAFIRMLERNNLIVDAYLDLKTGERKGKGMNSGTRFLILGTDVPEVGQVKAMMKAARTNGSQLIDSRVFMSLIGIKPPKGAAAPNYAAVNLGNEDAAPDAKDPMAPPAEPKKDKD
jgi:hypothetical protein